MVLLGRGGAGVSEGLLEEQIPMVLLGRGGAGVSEGHEHSGCVK